MAIFNKDKKEEAKKSEDKKTTKKASSKAKTTSKKKAAPKKKESTVSLEAKAQAYKVILGPLVTEKSAQLSDQNVIVLRVAPEANKVEIRNAVRALYQVTPTKVNVMNVRGKRVRFGRSYGKRSDWKKAVISLPEGTHIDIFEGV